MKVAFWEYNHEKFKKYIGIKKSPWKYDKLYTEKTYQYMKYIKWIPGLQMVWIWNSLSMNAGKKSSDIDLFIVTSSNTLWLVRILITLVFSLLGQRKTHTAHAGKFCLSFFATQNWLNFGSFALHNDIYLYFWIVYFKPILNYNNCYEKFLEVNTSWANLDPYKDMIEENKKYIKFDKKIWTVESQFLTIVNKLLKKCFLPKTLKSYKNIGKPYGIIINDDMLKFHNRDIRKKIRDELI